MSGPLLETASEPRPASAANVPALAVEGLQTYFFTRLGIIRAVDDVSFALDRRETLAIVGESGCGKSMTALSVMRLVPDPPGRIVGGTVALDGRDLLALDEAQMRGVRGKDISMIFQEPMTSLNPVLTIGDQIAEVLALHEGASRSAAMALACNPKVLIADEPTTALDVTIQAQILDLMLALQQEFGTAIILITHDLAVVAETAQRVIVMYAGKKVEEAEVEVLFEEPLHPYTRGLLASIPRLSSMDGAPSAASGRLTEIPGMVPSLARLPRGCAFAQRCAFADETCRTTYP